MAANEEAISGPFYHGTKADLKPGDLITPGYRSNYGDSKRTSPWVYMSATLSPWGAVAESCITEIGLSLETRLWIAVDADSDRLTFRVDADGPEPSWQRNLRLVRGVLTDTERGEIWDFGTDRPA